MTMLTRYNPVGEVLSLKQAMDRLFDDSFVTPAGWMTIATGQAGPAIDMWETPEEIAVSAALPGVAPEDVEITLTGPDALAAGRVQGRRPGLARPVRPSGAPIRHVPPTADPAGARRRRQRRGDLRAWATPAANPQGGRGEAAPDRDHGAEAAHRVILGPAGGRSRCAAGRVACAHRSTTELDRRGIRAACADAPE